jgi:hypothetical protein
VLSTVTSNPGRWDPSSSAGNASCEPLTGRRGGSGALSAAHACDARSCFEPSRFLRATRGVTSTVGMRPHPRQRSAVHDQVLIANGTTAEPALKDFAHPGGVARLGRETRPGDMRRHAMVRHRPPGVILRRRLREPDVAGVPGKLSARERPDNGIAVADLAARRIDQVRAAFHRADERVVEQMLGLGVQRAVDRDHVRGISARA